MKKALKKYGVVLFMCCSFAFSPYLFSCCDCEQSVCDCTQIREADKPVDTHVNPDEEQEHE